MNWFKKNINTIIRISYLIPILLSAFVSISHVITWYSLSNPINWAIYLSIGIEIAALSSLAGITTKINKWVYLPFIIVTFIQFVGNIFYSYNFIDVTNPIFINWVELTNPIMDSMGLADENNMLEHKRILAILSGGFIPLISLTFLHLLVSFNEKIEKKDVKDLNINEKIESVIIEKNDKDVIPPIKDLKEEEFNQIGQNKVVSTDKRKIKFNKKRNFSIDVPENLNKKR